jgi:hypothetical protein
MNELQLSKGERTHHGIIEAANELFLTQGYAAASMRQVFRPITTLWSLSLDTKICQSVRTLSARIIPSFDVTILINIIYFIHHFKGQI